MQFTFWHGVIMTSAINSLIQDFMGKDTFLLWATTHWIDSPITIPMAVLSIFLVCLSATRKRP